MITLYRNGQQDGPFTLEQVRAQIKGGVLSMGDPAWMEGWSDWKTVLDIPDLLEAPVPNFPTAPAEPVQQKLNISGSFCPNCGNRNSYRKSDGVGCLVMGILFVSLIGIFFLPFLPKSWHCRSCGNVWK